MTSERTPEEREASWRATLAKIREKQEANDLKRFCDKLARPERPAPSVDEHLFWNGKIWHYQPYKPTP